MKNQLKMFNAIYKAWILQLKFNLHVEPIWGVINQIGWCNSLRNKIVFKILHLKWKNENVELFLQILSLMAVTWNEI